MRESPSPRDRRQPVFQATASATGITKAGKRHTRRRCFRSGLRIQQVICLHMSQARPRDPVDLPIPVSECPLVLQRVQGSSQIAAHLRSNPRLKVGSSGSLGASLVEKHEHEIARPKVGTKNLQERAKFLDGRR
jgi:hypothetical protein